MLAPIILLVYNRPEHTRKTLESLMVNDLADKSTLFIYADGPKHGTTPEQLKRIKETREVLKEKQWCKQVNIIELEENLGVDEATINHVTNLINEFGKVIVLEDDIVTSKGFLSFMNDGLNLYEEEEQVMNISGYMFPVKKKLPSTVILQGLTGNWGWGTWRRAWSHFNPDYKFLADRIATTKELIRDFNLNNSFDYLKMLQESTEMHKPWDVRWYASVFLKNGFCIWPGNSLVQNIGHDASGMHCGITNDFKVEALTEHTDVRKLPLISNDFALNAIIEFNKSLSYVTLSQRVSQGLSSFIPVPLKNFLKNLLP